MDENQWNVNEPPVNGSYFHRQAPNGMAVASLVMGILSIVLLCCGFSFVVGSLGIVFALLSRTQSGMDTQAKVGLGLSIGGSVISILSVLFLLVSNDVYKDIRDEYEHFYQEYDNDYNYDYDYDFDDFDSDHDFDYDFDYDYENPEWLKGYDL